MDAERASALNPATQCGFQTKTTRPYWEHRCAKGIIKHQNEPHFYKKKICITGTTLIMRTNWLTISEFNTFEDCEQISWIAQVGSSSVLLKQEEGCIPAELKDHTTVCHMGYKFNSLLLSNKIMLQSVWGSQQFTVGTNENALWSYLFHTLWHTWTHSARPYTHGCVFDLVNTRWLTHAWHQYFWPASLHKMKSALANLFQYNVSKRRWATDGCMSGQVRLTH